MYAYADFTLLNFIFQRGTFREDINRKNILFKEANNGMKLVINKCENLRKERNKLLNKLNEINNTNYDELLKAIEYFYYSKNIVGLKEKLEMIIEA